MNALIVFHHIDKCNSATLYIRSVLCILDFPSVCCKSRYRCRKTVKISHVFDSCIQHITSQCVRCFICGNDIRNLIADCSLIVSFRFLKVFHIYFFECIIIFKYRQLNFLIRILLIGHLCIKIALIRIARISICCLNIIQSRFSKLNSARKLYGNGCQINVIASIYCNSTDQAVFQSHFIDSKIHDLCTNTVLAFVERYKAIRIC